jgi:hypothetical protein
MLGDRSLTGCLSVKDSFYAWIAASFFSFEQAIYKIEWCPGSVAGIPPLGANLVFTASSWKCVMVSQCVRKRQHGLQVFVIDIGECPLTPPPNTPIPLLCSIARLKLVKA